jgi:hypothetical protein
VRFALVLLIGFAAAAQDAAVIRQGKYVLWRDPGVVESLDFRYGEGGAAMAPKPPFSFLREEFEGSAPKVMVRDANQRQWSVKFGPEAHADTFCSRLAWALGYYVTPTHYVPEAMISGTWNLERAAKFIDRQGAFRSARLQLRGVRAPFHRLRQTVGRDGKLLRGPLRRGAQQQEHGGKTKHI